MNDIRVVDAKGKRVGRVASAVATYLMGKENVSFLRHEHAGYKVLIKNASSLDIPARKQKGKIYTRYTGYPSGLRHESMEQLIEKHGYGEVLRRAIYGMLPANKLRARMMKEITIEE